MQSSTVHKTAANFDNLNSYTEKFKNAKLTIGIVAGEQSGDILGGNLMAQLQAAYPNIEFVGMGGSLMAAQGLKSLFPMEKLSVMGLIEVIAHLPELFRIKFALVQLFLQKKIDIFIGIDAPDFNLRVAKTLKQHNIPTIQYVSPSVWAWREKRIHNIKASVDRVLCLFPFEVDFYDKHQMDSLFVGHPLTRVITPMHIQQMLTKYQLTALQSTLQASDSHHNSHISNNTGINFTHNNAINTIAILAGSRLSEVTRISPILFMAMDQYLKTNPNIKILIPAVNNNIKSVLNQQLDLYPNLKQRSNIILDQGDAKAGRAVMAASDVVVGASGTAMLEALLLHKPSIVVYKINALTYLLAKRLLKIPYVALPNILAKKLVFPELLQEHFTVDNIIDQLKKLESTEYKAQKVVQLQQLSNELFEEHNTLLVEGVLGLIKEK